MLNFRIFPDMTALADFAETAEAPRSKGQGDSFCKGTTARALELTRNGDLSGVASSEALLSKFEALTYETTRRVWRDDVVGSFPNVPAFIAGHPMNMRRRGKAPSDQGPIRIIADLFASASYSHEQIETRGAAILALARILTMSRPVELYVSFGSTGMSDHDKHTLPLVRIETAPLDLAHAAFAMTSPLFLRRTLFVANEGIGGQFPFQCLNGGELANIAARAFPSADQTVLIPGVVSSIVDDPQAWIIAQIRAAAPEMLEDAA